MTNNQALAQLEAIPANTPRAARIDRELEIIRGYLASIEATPPIADTSPDLDLVELASPMSRALAWQISGGLSSPRKMPCWGFSTPAELCNVGSRLRKVPGSICSKCYAMKGNYQFPDVKTALMRRYVAFVEHPRFVEAMVFLLHEKRFSKSGFFRWFDSGDIPGLEELDKIVAICKATPHLKHWLPTKEYGVVQDWLKIHGAFPRNLTVRLSAYMLEGKPPKELATRLKLPTSGVKKRGFNCPASRQDNKCMKCRACWQRGVKNVNYHQH